MVLATGSLTDLENFTKTKQEVNLKMPPPDGKETPLLPGSSLGTVIGTQTLGGTNLQLPLSSFPKQEYLKDPPA